MEGEKTIEAGFNELRDIMKDFYAKDKWGESGVLFTHQAGKVVFARIVNNPTIREFDKKQDGLKK